MTEILKKGSFVRAVIRDKEIAYLVCSNDNSTQEKVPHAVLMQWDNGEFGHIDIFNQYAAGVAVADNDKPQMVAVSEYGEVVVFGSGEFYKEKITDSITDLEITGPLRRVKNINGDIFVTGANQQLFSRKSRHNWLDLTPNLQDSKRMIAFESIDGFAVDELYAVGWAGAIYWLNGKTWKQAVSPTNLILTDVCCSPDGWVYACGQAGILLKGRYDSEWEVIETDIKEDFWNIAWFNDTLYLSSSYDVFKLTDEQIEPLGLQAMGTGLTFFDLSVKDGLMWSIGPKDILATDATTWWRVA